MGDEILNPEVPEVEAEVAGESTAPEAIVEGEFTEATPEVPGGEVVEGGIATPEEVATEETPEVQPE
jgi:hypothetical protein